jgi:predicted permease
MATFLKDLRYAARSLRKNLGFTAVAVISLALGIGANAGAFSIVTAMLLRPLPVEDPERLVSLFGRQKGSPPSTSSYPDYLDFRSLDDVFLDLAAHSGQTLSLGGGNRPEMVWAEIVTANYFSVVGAKPTLGRGFRPEEDDAPGGNRVAMLSHGLWKRRFGADPGIVGKSIRLNGRNYTVVGVAPRGFLGTRLFSFAPDVFVPLSMSTELAAAPELARERRDYRWLWMVGRLRFGVGVEQAEAAVRARARTLQQDHPDTNRGFDVQVYSNRAPVNPWVLEPGTLRRMMALVMLAMTLVLLIACANVANLLLARAASRRKEIAIRLSIGSSRGRLVRQLLTESLLLALVSGGVGLLLAYWLVDLSAALRPTLDFNTAFDLRIDARVIAFTAAASVLTAIVFGLVPALQASRPSVVPALKDETSGRVYSKSKLRDLLVVAQIALALMLLIGAGLFVQSFRTAQRMDPGFNPRGALLASMDLDLLGYDETSKVEFQRRLVERVEALPGVRSVSLAYPLPLDAYASATEVTEEGQQLAPDERAPEVFFSIVAPRYFETIQTPLVAGRGFEERDRTGAPPVVIVNETLARTFWPSEDPLGRRLSLRGAEGPYVVEVVGVTKSGKYLTLGEDPRPYMFLPLRQNVLGRMTLIVRTRGEPEAIAPTIRKAVHALDPELPLFGVKTLEQQMETPLSGAESGATMVGFFGVLAMLLAASGIYGVISYAVAQRTREIGIRVALGARKADVLRLVIGRGALLAAIGIALGAAGAAALGRALSGFLYGISATDPLTFAGISLLLGAVALLASYVPALRATRVNPLVALRYE